MAAQLGSKGGEFRIGRVLGRSARIWARNIVPLTLICLLATLPVYVPRLVTGPVMTNKQLIGYVPVLLTTLLTSPLSYAIFVVAVFQELAGGKMRIGPAIVQAFSRILPLLACTFCSVLAIAGGMILLFVPGLIVLTLLSVANQACVIERLGPIASLSRSAALTKGLRWRVFGLILLVGLTSTAAAAIAIPLQTRLGFAGVVVAFLLGGLAAAFRDTVYAVTFHDLRVCKEGVGTERIAAVFD
jgi:hypothetical protein